MATEVGEKVRALRKKKGLTLDQLAEMTNTSKSRIWELENRDNARPTAEKIHRIAEVLEVTPEYLMASGSGPPDDEEADRAFYRQYKRMPTETRRKIRAMVKLWSDD
ncbi:MAG: helix-turn-helix transcriptional regulator [Magnetococcales bacterium]|nr:helix-turn-helix transcriptional regulator [Magnetococcales bacterium]